MENLFLNQNQHKNVIACILLETDLQTERFWSSSIFNFLEIVQFWSSLWIPESGTLMPISDSKKLNFWKFP